MHPAQNSSLIAVKKQSNKEFGIKCKKVKKAANLILKYKSKGFDVFDDNN